MLIIYLPLHATAFESFNDWGGRGCHKFVSVFLGGVTKIAPAGDLFDQPTGEIDVFAPLTQGCSEGLDAFRFSLNNGNYIMCYNREIVLGQGYTTPRHARCLFIYVVLYFLITAVSSVSLHFDGEFKEKSEHISLDLLGIPQQGPFLPDFMMLILNIGEKMIMIAAKSFDKNTPDGVDVLN